MESGPLTFHYIIENNVCYLTLAERAYPKKLAFQYLEELNNEFSRLYGSQIDTVARPYAFIKFGECFPGLHEMLSHAPSVHRQTVHGGICLCQHIYMLMMHHIRHMNLTCATCALGTHITCLVADTFIQKTKKLYADTRTQRNMDRLNADISEVHSIMTKNIQEVLGHGERLDSELFWLCLILSHSQPI